MPNKSASVFWILQEKFRFHVQERNPGSTAEARSTFLLLMQRKIKFYNPAVLCSILTSVGKRYFYVFIEAPLKSVLKK